VLVANLRDGIDLGRGGTGGRYDELSADLSRSIKTDLYD
jgi:hypothetical protein